jgi:meiotically up-regulated gene 157 (Mug157) protein
MTKEKLAHQEALAFEVWMRETIKTVHYADNDRMAEAYNRVFNNTLELTIYESTDKKRREPN